MPDGPIKPSAYFMAESRMSAKPVSKLISIRLSEDLLERLAHVGNAEGLAMSDTIRLVLERGLSKSPPTKKPTRGKQS